MKKLFLTLCAFAALSSSAFADWTPAQRYYYTHTTYEQRYGYPRFTKEELAQRQRDDEDYERNGQLYEKLDEIETQLEILNEQQGEVPDPPPLTRAQQGFLSFDDYANAGKAPRAQLVKPPR
jgi:hypothetical protein